MVIASAMNVATAIKAFEVNIVTYFGECTMDTIGAHAVPLKGITKWVSLPSIARIMDEADYERYTTRAIVMAIAKAEGKTDPAVVSAMKTLDKGEKPERDPKKGGATKQTFTERGLSNMERLVKELKPTKKAREAFIKALTETWGL